MINIQGMDKAEVLAKLYNASKPQGLGWLVCTPVNMGIEEARELLDTNPDNYFDYVKGRVMKVDLSEGSLDERLYDRDNGPGAAARALGL